MENSKTISSKIPDKFYGLIEKNIKKDFVSISDYVRHLIREDLEKRGLI